MATLTISPQSKLIELMKPHLNRWEDLIIDDRFGEYIITLRTDVMVHRKHTAKSLFTHQTFVAMMSVTAIPNPAFIKEWLKNARKSTTANLNKGDYSVEKRINGEWQFVKAKFNQWIYYDRKSQMLCGKVNTTPPKQELNKEVI